MRQVLIAFNNIVINIFSSHKLFVGLLFLLTAGQEFSLPEWLDITLGLAMMFTVIIFFLNQQ